VLVFLAVANVGESVIFTASTLQSVLFWYAAILSLSLRPRAQESTLSNRRVARPTAAFAPQR
jgi:hypothetical protein